MRTLYSISRVLQSGHQTSRDLVEESLQKIRDIDGQGKNAFVNVAEDDARLKADRVDHLRAQGIKLPQFSGIPISIKDLFDTKGEVTRAGSKVLEDCPPAERDAMAVTRLRAAGFIVIGRANMNEFAYSGLGINNNTGTPLNPYDRKNGRIPGGSSSGGAVGVADGMVVATLGSDTGGSCRIPAAFCGIVGFKPTSSRVPKAGSIPLSKTLDSIGPLANSVACCEDLDSCLSGDTATHAVPEISSLSFAIPDSYLLDDLDGDVSKAFEKAVEKLALAGAKVKKIDTKILAELPHVNRMGGIVGAEAFNWHKRHLEQKGDLYDPWVKSRFPAGASQTAADFIELLEHRQRIRKTMSQKTRPFDAVLLPTVSIIPPLVKTLVDQDIITSTNLKVLRNTSVANFLDRDALSIPCHEPSAAPVGFMLMGNGDTDRKLLAVGRTVEALIRHY